MGNISAQFFALGTRFAKVLLCCCVTIFFPCVANALTFECEVSQRWGTLPVDGAIQRRDQGNNLEILGANWLGWPKFTFDDGTGVLRWRNTAGKFSDPMIFRMFQPGTSTNDIVAVRDGGCTVSCDIDVLRVRAWERPTAFSLLGSNGILVVGHCAP